MSVDMQRAASGDMRGSAKDVRGINERHEARRVSTLACLILPGVRSPPLINFSLCYYLLSPSYLAIPNLIRLIYLYPPNPFPLPSPVSPLLRDRQLSPSSLASLSFLLHLFQPIVSSIL